MYYQHQVNLTAAQVSRWLRGQCALLVLAGVLWLVTLDGLQIAGGHGWALLATLLSRLPLLGGPLGLAGPALSLSFAGAPVTTLQHLLWAYIGIQLCVYVGECWLKRTRLPLPWYSTLVPPAFAWAWPTWGVLAAPPILLLLGAHRMFAAPPPKEVPQQQKFEPRDEGIVLPPEKQK